MNLIRPASLGFLAALLFLSGPGCSKSDPGQPNRSAAPVAPAASPDMVARVHWIGKIPLTLQADSYYFMRLWNMPETTALQTQSLHKLSSFPWRLLYGEAQVTNVFGFLLRPLLNDLVQEEWYLEIRQPTNQAADLALAIRLNAEQAGRWQTNLAGALYSLTGGWSLIPKDSTLGWRLQKPSAPDNVEMVRTGDWTLVGLAHDTNMLLREFAARIRRNNSPCVASVNPPDTNYWLEADFDPVRVARALGLDSNSAPVLPRLSLAVTGDGANVLTRGDLTFPSPIPVQYEPWKIPVQLMHQPLTSFTALRGFEPWLASCPWWRDLQIGAPPNQLFAWSPGSVPLQIHVAAVQPNAVRQIPALTDVLLHRGNSWLQNSGSGQFETAPDANGAIWKGLSLLSPFVTVENDLALGGLLAVTNAEPQSPPPGLPMDLLEDTNLVCYDWEDTGSRMESSFVICQTLRTALRHTPVPTDSTAITWLQAIAPRLGTSRTVITCSGSNQLTFTRRSSLGLTAFELQLLADWLESPQFPRGLYSLLTPPAAPQTPAPTTGN